MARSLISRVVDTDIDGTRFLAIARFLRDADGREERAKGGLWIKADDAEALASACETALAFAAACEKRHTELMAKPAPKSARAPTQAPPAAPAPAKRALLATPANGAVNGNVPVKNRAAVVAAARASRPRVSSPAPAPAPASKSAYDPTDWANLIG